MHARVPLAASGEGLTVHVWQDSRDCAGAVQGTVQGLCRCRSLSEAEGMLVCKHVRLVSANLRRPHLRATHMHVHLEEVQQDCARLSLLSSPHPYLIQNGAGRGSVCGGQLGETCTYADLPVWESCITSGSACVGVMHYERVCLCGSHALRAGLPVWESCITSALQTVCKKAHL
jgi:hypothetical protein